ncbi:unnamed protein product [Auanema sp. JU1783]|nr:unnamed protein product [Auanema sp. JU1783]
MMYIPVVVVLLHHIVHTHLVPIILAYGPSEEYLNVSVSLGTPPTQMFKILILLSLVSVLKAASDENTMRSVDVNKTIEEAKNLRLKMKGKLADEITKIISILGRLTLKEVSMLKDPNRKKDNELVDLANKINNLIIMISEDPSDPSGVGSLIMAGNDLTVYLNNHPRGESMEKGKASS